MHTHEVALEAAEGDRAQVDGKHGTGVEMAKEILAEVFHALPGKVEDMIRRRLEESWPMERKEGRWPATFCLGE
jgi:hypothetical protein